MWGAAETWQAVALAALVAVAALPLARLRRADRRSTAIASGLAIVLALLTMAGALGWSLATRERMASAVELRESIPAIGLPGEGFITSDTCRSCHPGHWSSWHASFHRTMTQPARPESVLGDFDGALLASHGRTYALDREGGSLFATMVDPEWEHDRLAEGIDPTPLAGAPVVRRRVIMTTGSHHMQTYWVAGDRDGRLFNLPFVWLNEEDRWIPREDVFLRPPDFPRQFGTWHDNCIECHAVAGEPEHDREAGTFSPRVAELGIACEACHGPAEEHIRAHRDPFGRVSDRRSDEPDPTIINPRRLSARASSQVCGQCHGMNIHKVSARERGERYRAGGDLTRTRIVLRTSPERMLEDELADWPLLERHIAGESESFLDERFWSDGTVSISGREHNGLVESACFLGGELSCLSCHSMHESDPDDQLASGMASDGACLQCHAEYGSSPEAHTHHAAGSAGSRCMNCHMPHTTYGLLKAIRSHKIDSPTALQSLGAGRPNACNLCHLDKTLRWTAEHLDEWYGQERPAALAGFGAAPQAGATVHDDEISAAVDWLLRGDARQRAILAWHFGWEPAREASGRTWYAPYLAHLLADPYACVRYIAARSLRRVNGYSSLTYDWIGDPAQRSSARERAVGQWLALHGAASDRRGPAVLIDERGEIDRERLTSITRERNDRPVDLRE